MPNHIANQLSFKGNEVRIKELLQFVRREDSDFDFNTIIPLPESLNIVSGSATDISIAYYKYKTFGIANEFESMLGYPWVINEGIRTVDELVKYLLSSQSPMSLELGETAYKNIQNYGHMTWYEWSRENWGTKWNAYSIDVKDSAVSFDTAWSAPHPVIESLAKKFSDIKIVHKYADEDMGYNTGEIHYENGEIIFEYFPDGGSPDAYQLYIETHGESECLEVDKNGNYSRKDCDKCDGC